MIRAVEGGGGGERTNDTQISEDRIDLAPFHTWQSREAIEHLPWRLVEKLAKEMVQDQAGDVEQGF